MATKATLVLRTIWLDLRNSYRYYIALIDNNLNIFGDSHLQAHYYSSSHYLHVRFSLEDLIVSTNVFYLCLSRHGFYLSDVWAPTSNIFVS